MKIKLPNLRDNIYFWYGLIIFGIILSLFIMVSSLSQLFLHKASQYPAETVVKPVSSGKPLALYSGNITGGQLALALFTGQKGHASIYLQSDGDSWQKYSDRRSADYQDKLHSFVIDNLEPNRAYKLMFCTNWQCQPDSGEDWYGLTAESQAGSNSYYFSEKDFSIKGKTLAYQTGPALNPGQNEPVLSYGRLENMQAPALLLFQAKQEGDQNNSSSLMVLAGDQGTWAVDLSNLRNSRLDAFYPLADDAQLTVSIVSSTDLNPLVRQFKYSDIKDKEIIIKP